MPPRIPIVFHVGSFTSHFDSPRFMTILPSETDSTKSSLSYLFIPNVLRMSDGMLMRPLLSTSTEKITESSTQICGFVIQAYTLKTRVCQVSRLFYDTE